MDHSRELEAAFGAVCAAARITRAVQERLVAEDTYEKKDRSPVTVADWASQAVVTAHLHQALPALPLVGEEDAAALRDPANEALRDTVFELVRGEVHHHASGDEILRWIDQGNAAPCERFWTLDPIDGTKGFLRGEQYAIALGLIENGEVVLGAMACPQMGPGLVFTALRGHGARVAELDQHSDSSKISVQAPASLSQYRFCESVEAAHSSHSHAAQIADRLGIATAPVRLDSQAKYATVAKGDAQIYLRLPTRADYRERIWDHAAGAIVVQEAGGTVTDAYGAPLDFSRGRLLENNRGIIASAGHHDEIVRAVGAVLGA